MRSKDVDHLKIVEGPLHFFLLLSVLVVFVATRPCYNWGNVIPWTKFVWPVY